MNDITMTTNKSSKIERSPKEIRQEASGRRAKKAIHDSASTYHEKTRFLDGRRTNIVAPTIFLCCLFALATCADACVLNTTSLVVPPKICGATGWSKCTSSPPSTGLRTAAEKHHKIVGAAVKWQKGTGFLNAFHEFGGMTAEIANQWGHTQYKEGKWDFYTEKSEFLIQQACCANMTYHWHALLWHIGIPNWVRYLNASRLHADMLAHIHTVVTRYKGRVSSYDVLNEIIADVNKPVGDGGLRTDSVFHKLGTGFVADALNAAHKADPQARLFINDYAIEGNSAKTERLYQLAKRLLAAKVPLHGIGFQCHFFANGNPGKAKLKATMKRFTDLGLHVRLSELDISLKRTKGTVKDKELAQGVQYRGYVEACVETPLCDGVTVWGISSAKSWEGPAADALLFDGNYKKKDAYYGVLHGFGG